MRLFIFVCVLAIGGWFAKDYLASAPTNNKEIPAAFVSIAPVVRSDVAQNISLVGNVVAYETVNIKSRIDSQIVDVLFRDGDNATSGHPLFKLDDRALAAQLKQLQADVQKEKAQLENARLQYARARSLIATKAVSQAQLDNAKAAYEAQEAAVTATQASLENTRVQLSYTTINAPISGRAGTINVTRGNNVKANDAQALVVINRVQPIYVQFAIPERYYEAVKTQMAAGKVSVNARRKESGASAEGKLEYIDNAINTATGTFAARATFANQNEALWPGMFVDIRLELGITKGALTVPAVAIQGDESAHFVFRTQEGKAVRTPISLTSIEGETAVIASGINENDNVIVDGLLKVTDGGKVEVSKKP